MTAVQHITLSQFVPEVTQYRGRDWVERIRVHPTARRLGIILPAVLGPATALLGCLLLLVAGNVTGEGFLSWVPGLAMTFRDLAEASMPATIVIGVVAGTTGVVLLVLDRRVFSVVGQVVGLVAMLAAAGCAAWVCIIASFGVALILITLLIWAVIIAFWIGVGIIGLAVLGAFARD